MKKLILVSLLLCAMFSCYAPKTYYTIREVYYKGHLLERSCKEYSPIGGGPRSWPHHDYYDVVTEKECNPETFDSEKFKKEVK